MSKYVVDQLQVFRACVKAWPERPVLDSAEWPCTREELEQRIDKAMGQLHPIMTMASELDSTPFRPDDIP